MISADLSEFLGVVLLPLIYLIFGVIMAIVGGVSVIALAFIFMGRR